MLTTEIASAPGVPRHQRHARRCRAAPARAWPGAAAGCGPGRAPTIRRTHSGSAPNSIPPARVLGQDRLSSKPGDPRRSVESGHDLGVFLDREADDVDQDLGAPEVGREPGQLVAADPLEPRIGQPDRVEHAAPELGHAGRRVAVRGAQRDTALVTSPPRRSRSMTPSSSRPKPAVPAARRSGFWKERPKTVRESAARRSRLEPAAVGSRRRACRHRPSPVRRAGPAARAGPGVACRAASLRRDRKGLERILQRPVLGQRVPLHVRHVGLAA